MPGKHFVFRAVETGKCQSARGGADHKTSCSRGSDNGEGLGVGYSRQLTDPRAQLHPTDGRRWWQWSRIKLYKKREIFCKFACSRPEKLISSPIILFLLPRIRDELPPEPSACTSVQYKNRRCRGRVFDAYYSPQGLGRNNKVALFCPAEPGCLHRRLLLCTFLK